MWSLARQDSVELPDTEDRWVVTRGRGWVGKMGEGVKRYKPPAVRDAAPGDVVQPG